MDRERELQRRRLEIDGDDLGALYEYRRVLVRTGDKVPEYKPCESSVKKEFSLEFGPGSWKKAYLKSFLPGQYQADSISAHISGTNVAAMVGNEFNFDPKEGRVTWNFDFLRFIVVFTWYEHDVELPANFDHLLNPDEISPNFSSGFPRPFTDDVQGV